MRTLTHTTPEAVMAAADEVGPDHDIFPDMTPTVTTNRFGGYDSDNGRARVVSDDIEVVVYRFSFCGEIEWRATFSPQAPASVVAEVWHEARR